MNSLVVVLLLAVTSLSVTTTAFVVAPTTPKQHARRSTTTTSYMVPRYDPTTQRWSPSDNDESAKANYPPIRSLLRHGPKAFLVRTIQPDQYDQAVLKFMAKENCGRWVAQGNMVRTPYCTMTILLRTTVTYYSPFLHTDKIPFFSNTTMYQTGPLFWKRPRLGLWTIGSSTHGEGDGLCDARQKASCIVECVGWHCLLVCQLVLYQVRWLWFYPVVKEC